MKNLPINIIYVFVKYLKRQSKFFLLKRRDNVIYIISAEIIKISSKSEILFKYVCIYV